MAESFTPVFLLTTGLLMFLANIGLLIDRADADSQFRYIQVIQFFLHYFLTNGMMGGTYLPQLLFRVLTLLVFSYVISRHRKAMGDIEEENMIALFGMTIVVI